MRNDEIYEILKVIKIFRISKTAICCYYQVSQVSCVFRCCILNDYILIVLVMISIYFSWVIKVVCTLALDYDQTITRLSLEWVHIN